MLIEVRLLCELGSEDGIAWGAKMQEEHGRVVRILALATGTVCGLLVTLTLQVVLGHLNVEFNSMWHNLFASPTAQARSAMAWWLIAGTALVAGFITAAIARFLMLNWWPLRGPRWVLGAAIVVGLAAVGHMASEPSEFDATAHVAAGVAGMTVAMLTACLGAFFAARR